MTAVDKKIYEIIGEDSVILPGLPIPESGRPLHPVARARVEDEDGVVDDDLPSHEDSPPEPAPPRKKKRVAYCELLETKRKKQNDLLDIEYYYKQLKCAKLEQELSLQPSVYTENVRVLENV